MSMTEISRLWLLPHSNCDVKKFVIYRRDAKRRSGRWSERRSGARKNVGDFYSAHSSGEKGAISLWCGEIHFFEKKKKKKKKKKKEDQACAGLPVQAYSVVLS